MSAIIPPLNCSPIELSAYVKTLKEGDSVREHGTTAMSGQTGIVEFREGVALIRWDTRFRNGTRMATTFTSGARILTAYDEDEEPEVQWEAPSTESGTYVDGAESARIVFRTKALARLS